ncbi:rhamnulokinase [Deinococcus radiotolerans]|uniref:Carbohydrate kinase n=1 Tax=Deinococcus radiotolerans TaxID=1309407 RepID=A0ABQ2FP32_9DEIO|nr:rhamnulokinase family protein [Deinococcus radiotolerans]GGL12902.1 carbohydrate kinase [Deinococcus radiotolerans]
MSADVKRHVAIDLGASSGRVALGTVRHGRLSVEVLHRFQNGGVPVQGGLYWDVLGLWREILHGLRLAAQHGHIDSVGVDSWAVDYALLDEHDLLMDGVHHYRDPRTDGVMQHCLNVLPRSAVYEATGIQFLPFNTAYQLVAHERQAPGILSRACQVLMVPDLLHFWLSGRRVSELTNASTTQLYDPRQDTWSAPVLHAFGLPAALFPDVVPAGTVLGPVTPAIAQETGLAGTVVIAPATHDTASAVAAVPARGSGWAYLSSGTWSLVGIETLSPVVTPQALRHNLTNEAGVNGTTRLLKNVMGLWIVQECRRAWGNPDFAQLYADAEKVPGTGPLIDPDDPRFLHAGLDMPERIQAFCAQTGQAVPTTPAELVRCVLDSLALRSAEVIRQLEEVTGRAITVLHVVGGGAQLRFLNQLLADVTGCTVIAGPVEATLIGNLLVQAEASGSIPPGSLRDVVLASEVLDTFEPRSAVSPQRLAFFAALGSTPVPS